MRLCSKDTSVMMYTPQLNRQLRQQATLVRYHRITHRLMHALISKPQAVPFDSHDNIPSSMMIQTRPPTLPRQIQLRVSIKQIRRHPHITPHSSAALADSVSVLAMTVYSICAPIALRNRLHSEIHGTSVMRWRTRRWRMMEDGVN